MKIFLKIKNKIRNNYGTSILDKNYKQLSPILESIDPIY